jgi:alkylation response protein AidB-like acyl-CoA dehydrogenase
VDFSEIELDADVAEFWADEVVPFMDEHLSPELLEQEHREGNGFVPAYQRALAARGWLAPSASSAVDDAAALDGMRSAIVQGEEGRRVGALFPVAGSHSLVMSVVRMFGSVELHTEIDRGNS